MQLIPMFAEITDALKVVGGVVAVLFVFFIFAGIWASRYTKVGPNQVLVISGRKRKVVDPDGNTREVGFRIVKGGGRFVWPVYEKVDILSLEILTIDVQTPEVYTSKGVPVKVDGVAQMAFKRLHGDALDFVGALAEKLFRGRGDGDVIALDFDLRDAVHLHRHAFAGIDFGRLHVNGENFQRQDVHFFIDRPHETAA